MIKIAIRVVCVVEGSDKKRKKLEMLDFLIIL